MTNSTKASLPSRRTVLQGAAFSAAALLLSSCAPGGTPAPKPSASGAGANALDGQKLIAQVFGAATGERFSDAVYGPFASANGVAVTQVPMHAEDALARMLSETSNPQIDLYQFTGGQERVAKQKGLTAKIGDLAENEDIPDDFKDPDGQWVASAVLPEGIVYRTDKITRPPRSYKDFMNPEYEGHVAFPTITNGWGMDFLVMLARTYGGGEKDIDPGFEALEKLAAHAIVFKAASEMQTLFSQADVWIMPYDLSNAWRTAQAGLPVAFVSPAEGSPANLVTQVIAKESNHLEAARAAVQYSLRPDAQAKIATDLRWFPTNSKTKLPADVAKDIRVGADALKSLTQLDRTTMASNTAAWIDRFNRTVVK